MKILSAWRLAVLSLIGAGSRRAQDQASIDPIIVVFTQYHVKPAYMTWFREALHLYIIRSLQSTGNIMAEAYYEQGDPSVMWTIERWSNKTAYKGNKRSGAAKPVRTLLRSGLVSSVETLFVKDLELLIKEAVRKTPTANDQSLTILLLVTVKAGTEDHFRSINQAVISAFRQEPGVLLFQLGQIVDRKTSFVVYKKFHDREAFQYHLKDPALEPVMKFLQTSIMDPPFEKGYHHLIQFAPHF
jgi:quinol monooxygenase YgiN